MKRSKEISMALHLGHNFTPKGSHIAYRDFIAGGVSEPQL